MMKIDNYKSIILFLFTCILLGTSCADDKGNYDYKELEDVAISGIAQDISVLAFSDLNITPTFGQFDPSENEYEFEWKTIQIGGEQDVHVIGTTKNLNYLVELISGQYKLLYTVKKKGSEIYYRTESNLRVNAVTSEGWLVLCSDNNRARLDMVSKVTGETYHDILQDSDMPELKNPYSIVYLPSYQADANSPFYLLAENGATRLGKDDFIWKPEFDMTYEMGNGQPVFPYNITASAAMKMFISKGEAHYCDYSMQDGLYGLKINKNYQAAQGIGCNIMTRNIFLPFFLLYDVDSKQFTYYNAGLSPMIGDYEAMLGETGLKALETLAGMGLPFISGTAFDVPVGEYDYRYMENTKYTPDGGGYDGMTYTILTKGDNVYLYGFQMGDYYAGQSPVAECKYTINKAYYGDLSGCTDISRAEHFAFSSLKNFMYYSVGNQVYRINLSENPLKAEPQFNLPGETITCLKFYLYTETDYANRSYDLIVGSQKTGDESTSGILRVYDGLDKEGDFYQAQPKETHTGFTKIVDVIFREIVTITQ